VLVGNCGLQMDKAGAAAIGLRSAVG